MHSAQMTAFSKLISYAVTDAKLSKEKIADDAGMHLSTAGFENEA